MNAASSAVAQAHRTRVKICGLTRPEDVDAACEAGVDAVGFICYPPSARHVSVAQFRLLSERVGPFVTVVAVVVDPNADYLAELVDHVGIDVLQFHGEETPEFCQQWAKPWIKAARVRAGMDLNKTLIQTYARARGWLVDAYSKDAVGGTGETFNWDLLDSVDRQRLVLAGGLSVENIEQAICRVRPFAVDISSGVENAPGIKDAQRIGALVSAVHKADALVCATS